ncbi:hypothetical protein FHW16_005335 [Phyllobacterium myrsinacearum]|uniref:Uncharacterized protein n=1 Tax=Phyllobacterium myrsinacearum TaxID=28101 RepID=A0A839EVQ2_9HYPH|nr:hypothetical protein [Phyllobacterium myrsinacearum]
MARGPWFDKLTMRESGAVGPTGKIAGYDSLQSSLSLMVSLSNHGPHTHPLIERLVVMRLFV